MRISIFLSLLSTLFFATLAYADGHGSKMASSDMLTNACVACHGANGVSNGPAIPTIAGVTKNYFIGAMLAYKYDNDPEGLEKAMDELRTEKEYEDAESLMRYSTIMGRLAKGYTVEEIKVMANVFADAKYMPAQQSYKKSQVALGESLHEEYCDKCHEDGGLSPVDDVGILAGQWMRYTHYSLDDYMAGRSDMPKKMKKALKDVKASDGENGIAALLQYYASAK